MGGVKASEGRRLRAPPLNREDLERLERNEVPLSLCHRRSLTSRRRGHLDWLDGYDC